ncbi:MAG TPA: hypothetical protein VHR15_13370 [Ktedonobacterales bacterium]|nr:hypothetical protein [Ktedonobacterales bacterium]
MSAQQPYESTGPASDYPTDPAVASPRAKRHRRSRFRRALVALTLLLIVAVVAGIFLYNFLTAYFAVNGTWYGPMKLQVGPTTVTLQAYVDLSTHLNGDLVGTGTICSKTPITNAISTVATGVTGKRDDGQKISLSFAASTNTIGLPFLGVTIGPGLELHGTYTSLKKTSLGGLLVDGTADSMKLSGDAGAAPVSLTMKRGTQSDFTKACNAQPAVG